MTDTTDLDHLKTLISYLGEPRSKNKSAVREELLEFIRTADLGTNATLYVVSLGDPGVILAYQERYGDDIIKVCKRGMSRAVCPANVLNLAHQSQEDLVRCMQIIKPHTLETPLGLARTIVSRAFNCVRPELIVPLWDALEIDPQTRDDAFLLSDALSQTHEKLVAWASTYPHSGFDLTFEDWMIHIKRGTEHNQIFAAAVALIKGHDIRPAFERYRDPLNGAWQARLDRRISSNHGLVSVLASLPSIDEMLAMNLFDLRALVAGRSNNEAKKIAKKERRLANRAAAMVAASGLSTPSLK